MDPASRLEALAKLAPRSPRDFRRHSADRGRREFPGANQFQAVRAVVAAIRGPGGQATGRRPVTFSTGVASSAARHSDGSESPGPAATGIAASTGSSTG